MLITKKNFDEKLKEVTNIDKELSENVINTLKNNNMTIVGNSISAGYSKNTTILPFIQRTHLYDLGSETGNLTYYDFARVRRNAEPNIIYWYNQNIKQQELRNLCLADIDQKTHKYPKFWTDEERQNYVDLPVSDIGMKDCIKLDNNIIIYCGFTGLFTNAIRNGKFKDILNIPRLFKKDAQKAEMIFQEILIDNPMAQIYVVGLPNLMGTGIVSDLDYFIKKICKDLPNTIYVPGVHRNYFSMLPDQHELDVHYNTVEYIALWNNILTAIKENYLPVTAKLKILYDMNKASLSQEHIGVQTFISDLSLLDILSSQNIPNINTLNKQHAESIIKYFEDNYLRLYPNIPREAANDIITRSVQRK